MLKKCDSLEDLDKIRLDETLQMENETLRDSLASACSFGNRLILENIGLEKKMEMMKGKQKLMKVEMEKMSQSSIQNENLEMKVRNLRIQNRDLKLRLEEEKREKRDLEFHYGLLKRDFQRVLKNNKDLKLGTIQRKESEKDMTRKLSKLDVEVQSLENQCAILKERRHSLTVIEPKIDIFKTPRKRKRTLIKQKSHHSLIVTKRNHVRLSVFVKTPSPRKRQRFDDRLVHRRYSAFNSLSKTASNMKNFKKYGMIKEHLQALRNQTEMMKKVVQVKFRVYSGMIKKTVEYTKMLDESHRIVVKKMEEKITEKELKFANIQLNMLLQMGVIGNSKSNRD